ncbi:Coiled-coil domain-containing protein 24 [Liparis tanakae]|uniref:Coiled-coil domain-containing protein 24 n=1 Tax=Liparis tanakae TaxID=230148 RepID=A0A4Z2FJN1_9TELE|nr:Coiled-coil domain-containing protein 24 [Liparis tanakae]
MQSLDGAQLWCPGQSLWSLITEHVPGSELPKIHSALGFSLVDMYTEVHAEATPPFLNTTMPPSIKVSFVSGGSIRGNADMWHKMWQESQQGNRSSRAGTPLSREQASLLADPPAVKELVRAEVKMLLQTLRERASGAGRVAEELLFRYKPETVDYALSHLDSCYRNPGDTESGSRPSSRCSVQSNAEDEIEAMRDKLNVTGIDQGNIKQRWQSPCEVDKVEPSLADCQRDNGFLTRLCHL